jgi:long-chain acyl-CoA synthetase
VQTSLPRPEEAGKVQKISVPALTEADETGNLTDLVVRNATEAPGTVAFGRPGPDGWEDVTWRDFHAEVVRLARGFVAAGVQPGDRVALMSKTRYEWTLTDFAIWFAGGVTVPVYETSSAEQVAWILADSSCVAAVVETPRHAATVSEVREELPDLAHLWVLDEGAVDTLNGLGEKVDEEEIETRRRIADAASVATLIYTSGTTGKPKGCELSHANFIDLAANAVARLSSVVRTDGASTLLFLPLAHVFARFIQVLAMTARARMGHSPDVKNLLADLAEFRPTFVLAVPRVFEKIYNSAEAKAQGESKVKGAIFTAAARTAIAWSKAQDTGGPGPGLRIQHALFDRLVYGKLRAALGGQVRYAVSGGAPLGARLGHFFRGIGVIVLEGWGLTETTAPATVNTPELVKIGTVGLPLPGVSVAVAEDGELLVSGVNVMRGYYQNPDATQQALTDGWFHTGDLGDIDQDGYVRITGRKKEIIVTAGGKNVAPAVLEDRLRAHPLVSQCIVVGDQRPFIGCLVTLDADMLPTWLANHGKPAMDVAAAAADPEVRHAVQEAIDRANLAVSKAESIRKFHILDTDFTEAKGHLTAKLSLKRPIVLAEFAEVVEDLYR